jgi:hypothetical protein
MQMRRIMGAFAALAMLTVTAWAETAEGKITAIDADTLTITLDNGKTYKLPGEIDLDALSTNMTVLIAYQKVNGVNQITDMDLQQ